ncbi:SbtR family transcriptional regulator [Amycolatopsis nivea]
MVVLRPELCRTIPPALVQRLYRRAHNRGALLMAAGVWPGGGRPRRAMREAGEPLLARVQESGAARPESSIDDVLRMISGITAVEYVDGAQRERVFEFALAGLRR